MATASARVSTVDRLDGLEQLVGELRDVQALAADREARLPGGQLVDDRDLRLVRAARQRQADEDRDDHRVGDQQHHEQRRAAQDLQVLEQQPAHQCPRSCRKRTKAASKSRGSPPTSASQARRRAGEEDLAVGQHEHAVGVALGLADVVRGEDDRRPAAGQPRR